MKYGIRTASLQLDWEESLARARELGFDGIEFVVKTDEQVDMLRNPDGQETIRKWCADYDTEAAALSFARYRENNWALPDPEARDRGVKAVGEMCDACKAIGVTAILLPHFDRKKIDLDETELANFIDGAKNAAPKAEETQIHLSIETSFSVEMLTRIVDAVGSPYVGVYQDTANALIYGHDSVDMLTRLGKRINMIHIKDTDQTDLGDGRVDFPGCVEAIKNIPYDGWLVLETPAGDDALASARRNGEFARKLF